MYQQRLCLYILIVLHFVCFLGTKNEFVCFLGTKKEFVCFLGTKKEFVCFLGTKKEFVCFLGTKKEFVCFLGTKKTPCVLPGHEENALCASWARRKRLVCFLGTKKMTHTYINIRTDEKVHTSCFIQLYKLSTFIDYLLWQINLWLKCELIELPQGGEC